MQDMIPAVKTVLNNYIKFDERSGRPEFWWFALASFIASLALTFIGGFIGAGALLSSILSLALIVPTIAVGMRRLHDMGKSGWWLLIGLIPVLGWIAIIYFLAQPTASANEYGETKQPLMT